MSRTTRRFSPSVLDASLEARKLLDGSGSILPQYPTDVTTEPHYPWAPTETPPPSGDPLAPVLVVPATPPGIPVNMTDGTLADHSVE